MSADAPPPVVWVTGATGGIGRATALAYAGRGARLALLSRSPGRLKTLEQDCLEAGAADVLVVPADVLEADAVDEAFAQVVARFGRIDVCVHTAAVVAYGSLPDVPADVWDRSVATGLFGTSNVARIVLPQLAAQPGGGSLVVVGSVLGQVAVPYMSGYVTGKWAVRGLVRCLQMEARDTPGVHVGLVSPGAVDTPIYRLAATYVGREGRPPPPVVSSEYVAKAVLRCADGRRTAVPAGPVNGIMRLGFTATPWLYDRLVGPLIRVAGMRRGTKDATTGNVFTPSEDVEY